MFSVPGDYNHVVGHPSYSVPKDWSRAYPSTQRVPGSSTESTLVATAAEGHSAVSNNVILVDP